MKQPGPRPAKGPTSKHIRWNLLSATFGAESAKTISREADTGKPQGEENNTPNLAGNPSYGTPTQEHTLKTGKLLAGKTYDEAEAKQDGDLTHSWLLGDSLSLDARFWPSQVRVEQGWGW